MLMLAAHEHLHHTDTHDHEDAIQTAIHGHAHESSPDHEHEFTAPLSASRVSAASQLAALSIGNDVPADHRQDESHRLAVPAATSPGCGPPPYLMNCVLLT